MAPPAFDNTIKAFDLAHQLGVEPSCKMIRTLDRIVSTASASHDQPEPGPSSLGKRPRLEECLTTVKEDTVSLVEGRLYYAVVMYYIQLTC